jgi:hypothetical protein
VHPIVSTIALGSLLPACFLPKLERALAASETPQEVLAFNVALEFDVLQSF